MDNYSSTYFSELLIANLVSISQLTLSDITFWYVLVVFLAFIHVLNTQKHSYLYLIAFKRVE